MRVEPDAERLFERVPFNHQVTIEFISDKFDNCQIKDVSLGGMYVQGDFRKQREKNCHVDLVDTAGAFPGDKLHALAQIVREDDKGVGLEFVSMNYESYFFLLTSLLNKTHNFDLSKKILNENCPFDISDQLPESEESITFL